MPALPRPSVACVSRSVTGPSSGTGPRTKLALGPKKRGGSGSNALAFAHGLVLGEVRGLPELSAS